MTHVTISEAAIACGMTLTTAYRVAKRLSIVEVKYGRHLVMESNLAAMKAAKRGVGNPHWGKVPGAAASAGRRGGRAKAARLRCRSTGGVSPTDGEASLGKDAASMHAIMPSSQSSGEAAAVFSNEAVGAYEAAALMGVHYTRPKQMADKGLLQRRQLESSGGAVFAVYSSKECEDDFADYNANTPARRRAGEKVGRPRKFIHDRSLVLRVLADPKRPRISFDDAIGVVEASRILGVYVTRVIRVVEEGKIVGRIAWSQRGSRAKLWILSRASCEAHAAEVRRLEDAGLKLGRPRSLRSSKAS